MYNSIHLRIRQLYEQFKTLDEQGELEQARDLGAQLENFVRQFLSRTDPDYTHLLNDLALDYKYMANYEEAERLFKEVIDILRETAKKQPKLEPILELAHAWLNLAGLYEAMRNYRNAIEACEEALGTYRYILRESFSFYHNFIYPYYAVCLFNTALLLIWTGSYEVAKTHLENALEIHRQYLGDTHQELAIKILMNLAYIYEKLGNYQEASLWYEEALKISRKILERSDPDFIKSLVYLVGVYKQLRYFEKAEQLYKEAQEIRSELIDSKQQKTAIALHSLAYLYEEMENPEEALHLHEKALGILRKLLGSERSLNCAGILISLADLHKKMKNYNEATHLLGKALEIRRHFLGTEHILYGEILSRLAILHMVTDRETEALSYMQQVMTINEKIISQIFSTGTEKVRMNYLATIQKDTDLFISIVFHFKHSSEIIRAGLDLILQRKAITLDVLSVQQDMVLKGKYPHLKKKLQELTILRRKIATETLAGPQAQGLVAHHQLLEKWGGQRQMLEAQLAREIPEMTLESSWRKTNCSTVASALPNGTVLIEFVRTEICNFQNLSIQGEEWCKTAHYLVFILISGEPENVQMIDLGEAKNIDEMIATFRISITGGAENLNPEKVLIELIQAAKLSNISSMRFAIFEPLRKCGLSETDPIEQMTVNLKDRKLIPMPMKLIQKVNENTGLALRKAIFDPLLKAINDQKRLFLAPDGDLNRLPFEVLPLDENRRLIDEYYICYLSTSRDVLRFQAISKGQPSAPLVFGDPDFNLSTEELPKPTKKSRLLERQSRDLKRSILHFQRLPGTRVEGDKIAKQLGVQALLEGKALETLLKACCSPIILHLATHGFFLENQQHEPKQKNLVTRDRLSGYVLENPLLRSGLALAGANTWLKNGFLPPEAEDGILTAEDVSGLDLLNTDLVVLSACETGLGEMYNGEGVFGLRRAFVLAGAKRLVMSLWSVPDQQTQELMIGFYDRMLKGQPCADALRDAQLEMKKKYSNPLYWGAFIFQGNPSRLLFERTI